MEPQSVDATDEAQPELGMQACARCGAMQQDFCCATCATLMELRCCTRCGARQLSVVCDTCTPIMLAERGDPRLRDRDNGGLALHHPNCECGSCPRVETTIRGEITVEEGEPPVNDQPQPQSWRGGPRGADLEPFDMVQRVWEEDQKVHQAPVAAKIHTVLWIKIKAAARERADLTDSSNSLCGHLEPGTLVRVEDVADYCFCDWSADDLQRPRRLRVAKLYLRLYAMPPSVSKPVGWISNKGTIVSKQPPTCEELERGPNALLGLLRAAQRLLLSAILAEYSEDVLLTTAEMLSTLMAPRNIMESHGYGRWYMSQDEYKLVLDWCTHNLEIARAYSEGE